MMLPSELRGSLIMPSGSILSEEARYALGRTVARIFENAWVLAWRRAYRRERALEDYEQPDLGGESG